MRASLAIASATLLVGVLAAPAQATPYTVWSCRDAQGTPLSTAAWTPAGDEGTRADTCTSGGALDVALGTDATDTAPGAATGYRFDVPAGVTITGYTAWMAAETAAVPSSQARYVAGIGQGDELSVPMVLDGCNGNEPTCAVGTFADPLADANRTSRDVLGGRLALMVACTSTTETCSPDGGPPAHAALFRMAVDLDDPSAPTVDPIGGTIASGSPVSGIRSVTADVRDDGSGVGTTELLVDGAVVERQHGFGTCAPPFTVADPCPSSVHTTFVLDTATLADGAHSIAVRASDAAGNTATGAPTMITVAQPAPPAPPALPSPAPAQAAPSATAPIALRLEVPTRVALPARHRVTGTVTGANGGPRAGVRLRFEQRPFGGDEDDWRAMRASTVSDAAGRFRVSVPSASAQVRAVLAFAGFTATPRITSFVGRLKATIKASARTLDNGDRLTLRGRLSNAGGAAEDHTVLIQSRVRGSWRTVDSVEAQADGRITWRYRFTDTTRTARYRFRLVVPYDRHLPWKRVTSRQVSVLVRAG